MVDGVMGGLPALGNINGSTQDQAVPGAATAAPALLSFIAHNGTYSYKSLLIQILSLSLKVLNKTDNR